MMLLGLAAAPVFPLLTLTTADPSRIGGAPRTVGLQVAASAVGSAAVPSAIGLVIGAVSALALGPALLVLACATCAVYWLALRPVPADAGTGHARARVGGAGLSGANGRRRVAAQDRGSNRRYSP